MPFKKNEIPSGAILFKENCSGNPSGRPKGALNKATLARYWLEVEDWHAHPITGETVKITYEDYITLATIKQAMDGNVMAYKLLMDTKYGKQDPVPEIPAARLPEWMQEMQAKADAFNPGQIEP